MNKYILLLLITICLTGCDIEGVGAGQTKASSKTKYVLRVLDKNNKVVEVYYHKSRPIMNNKNTAYWIRSNEYVPVDRADVLLYKEDYDYWE